MKITLQPNVLQWARRRAGLSETALAKRLAAKPDQVTLWESTGVITYKRAEKLAEKTHTPFGYLFLSEPPEEKLPVADFRTIGSDGSRTPSPELLDVLFDAMRKQSWYRDYLIEIGQRRLDFVGAAKMEEDPSELAQRIQRAFALDSSLRSASNGWEMALSLIFERLEEHGVMLIRSGVAGGNPHRPLRVEEFRGFALSDPYAPLIFVNTRDSKAAQMFTVAHELVHLWLGLSGVSNSDAMPNTIKRVELFCNEVAAELLLPGKELKKTYAEAERTADPVATLCRFFNVSSLVVLRRLLDLGILDWETYDRLRRDEEERFRAYKAKQQEKGGGNFYATQQVRVGPRFARALIGSALEGRTPYREAFGLLGVKRTATFKEFARTLNFDIK